MAQISSNNHEGGHNIKGSCQRFHRFNDGEVVEMSEETRGKSTPALDHNRVIVGCEGESIKVNYNPEALLTGNLDNNTVHTCYNDTEAAQLANSIVDGHDCSGVPTISKDAFYQACAKHFPDVEPGEITNYITVTNATGCFTTYAVRQKTCDAAKQKAELERRSLTEGGSGKAPDMGV